MSVSLRGDCIGEFWKFCGTLPPPQARERNPGPVGLSGKGTHRLGLGIGWLLGLLAIAHLLRFVFYHYAMHQCWLLLSWLRG